MADEEDETGGRRARGAAIADAAQDTVNVFSMMEDINDKLKILHYETKFCKGREFKPLSRSFFAIPNKPSDQFPYFSALAAWLLSVIDSDFIEWNQFDDPNAISNTVMQELRKMGFVADFPVSKLRHGSGDACCLALNYLLDSALKKQGFAVQPPIYTNQEVAEEAAVDEDADMEEDMEEDVDEEDDDGLFTAEEYFAGPKNEDLSPEDLEMQQVLESKVDPKEWLLELERVGPRLKYRPNDTNGKEWRTHIEQSGKHEEHISKIFPETKGTLSKIGKELRAAVDRISAKERHINKEFDHLGGEFRDKQKHLDEIQERYNELSQSVSELTASLAEKTEQVEMIKNQMSERNNSMTDNSPLRRIGDALTELKKEVAAMDLRIGVVGQTLMQSKLKMATSQNNARRPLEEASF